jgi:hypothetical protein
MKTMFHGLWALACAGWAMGASAQVPVGPQGNAALTFDAAPPVQEWSTQSFGGDNGGAGIVDAAALDAQVQLVSASTVNRALGTTFTLPPAQNNYARWNSAGKYLQSRIGNVEFTVTMLTLLNSAGTSWQTLEVSYDLGGGLFSQEQVPGFRVYFSLTGTPGSWQVVPALCSGSTGTVAGVISFSEFGAWFPGAALFLLWADDNGPGSDGYYSARERRATTGDTPPGQWRRGGVLAGGVGES